VSRVPTPEHAWLSGLVGRLPKPLSYQVPGGRRTEMASVVTRRRRVVVAVGLLGSAQLRRSLQSPPGSPAFYWRTLSVAGIWTAGGMLSGPLHLGYIEARNESLRRPWLTPLATGLGVFGGFYAAAALARRVPVLDTSIARVLRFAQHGNAPLVLLTTIANGVGEEVFFRGALYAMLPERYAVTGSAAAYTLVTAATRNPALVLAAGVMGSLFGLQRRATGGLQAPTLTHLAWSALMVRYLPRLFVAPGRADASGRPAEVSSGG
jgi:uncharacterized protein